MLLRPQDFLNMHDDQRKLVKAYLKDCHVVLLLAGIMIWCKRVRVVLLTDAYSSFFLCNGLPWRFEALFPSLCEVSEQWFHSCQPSHGTKYLLTNRHWNSLFQVLTRLKQALFFFLPIWGCYYTRNLCLWQRKHKVNKFALSMLEKHTQVRLSLL